MKRQELCTVDNCNKPLECKGLCKTHYYRLITYGDINAYYPKKKKIEYSIDNNTGCFICTSHKPNVNGYPSISIKSKTMLMSRFIYTQMFGELDKSLVVRHKCDNPRCINPEHLISGTQKQNIQDIYDRKRNNNVKGEKVGRSKLSEENVLEIRRLRSKGVYVKEIAKKFGIHPSYVKDIYTKRTWKHI